MTVVAEWWAIEVFHGEFRAASRGQDSRWKVLRALPAGLAAQHAVPGRFKISAPPGKRQGAGQGRMEG